MTEASMSKHTPGPWTVLDEPNQLDDGGEDDVGSVAYMVESRKAGAFVAQHIYIDADASLIAAAPELLEALQALMARDLESRLSGFPEVAAARAAIAKATGIAA